MESPLVRDFKPTIAVALKWKFDDLARCLASLFEFEADVAYWQGVLAALDGFGLLGWFEVPRDTTAGPDIWKRTGHGFEVGWTMTREEPFAASRSIAEDRTGQIIDMFGGPQ